MSVVGYKAGADLRTKGEKAMQSNISDATTAALERLELCFSGPTCDWTRFYQPKDESMAMGSRYHFFYPALAYFVELKRDPGQADKIHLLVGKIWSNRISDRKNKVRAVLLLILRHHWTGLVVSHDRTGPLW